MFCRGARSRHSVDTIFIRAEERAFTGQRRRGSIDGHTHQAETLMNSASILFAMCQILMDSLQLLFRQMLTDVSPLIFLCIGGLTSMYKWKSWFHVVFFSDFNHLRERNIPRVAVIHIPFPWSVCPPHQHCLAVVIDSLVCSFHWYETLSRTLKGAKFVQS